MAIKVQKFAENLSWLGSVHALRNARTVTIDTADFAGQATGGIIPSGTPVTITGGTAAPYTGTGTFSGFILTDQPATGGKIPVPVLDHGRVNIANLPVEFTPPAAADDKTGFTYVEEA